MTSAIASRNVNRKIITKPEMRTQFRTRPVKTLVSNSNSPLSSVVPLSSATRKCEAVAEPVMDASLVCAPHCPCPRLVTGKQIK